MDLSKLIEALKKKAGQAATSVSNTVSNAVKQAPKAASNALTSYSDTYQKVSPYVPFAPKVANPTNVTNTAKTLYNNVAAPIIKTTAQSFKPLVDYVDPRGYEAERRNPNLGTQKLLSAAKAEPMAALNLYGLSKLTPATTAASYAISGGVNYLADALKKKASLQSFTTGGQKGLEAAPLIGAIGSFTNPVISQGAGKLSNLVNNPLAKQALSRLATGTSNIPEGYAMSKALGQKYDPTQALMDFTTGVIGGSPTGAKVKGSVGSDVAYNQANELEQRTRVLADKYKDYRAKNPDWSENNATLKNLRNTIEGNLKKAAELRNSGSKGFNMGITDEATKTVKIPDTTSEYNVGNIKTQKPEVVEQAIKDVAPEFKKVVGDSIKHEDIIKNAQTVETDLIKTIGRAKTEELGAAQLRIRQNIARMSDEGRVTPEYLQAMKTDAAFARSTAQLFGQRAIEAGPSTEKGKLMNQMLKNILKMNDDMDGILEKAKGVDFNDPNQAAEFYRQYIKPTTGEWVDKVRYNSMLSSPTTQIVNASSNLQGTGVLTPIQKTIEGGIDSMISGITGKDRTRFAGEGAAYAKGYYGNVKTAFKNMVDVFSGKRSIDNPDLRNIPLATSKTGKVIETALDIPSRVSEGVDQFFKALTTGGLEESYKYRLAKGGKNLAPDAAKEANDLLFRGKLNEEGKGAISNAVGAGAEWVKRGTQSSNKAVRWMAKLTFPFMNTGTNLVKAGLEGNPVTGTINMIGNKDKTAQAAKMVMGGAVMTIGSMFALNDKLTFAEPTNYDQRNAFRKANMQPYSVKIGDRWYQYSKLHPLIAFQLGMVAALTDAYKKKKIGEDTASVIAQGMWQSLQFVADQSYFKNIGDFVGTMNGDVDGLTKLASNYPSQAIPFRALMGWTERIVDEYQRQPDKDADFFTKSFQQIASQIPGLAGTVPTRKDKYGQPIKNPDRVINALSPVKTAPVNQKGEDAYNSMVTEAKGKTAIRDASTIKNQAIDMYLTGNMDGAMKIKKENGFSISKKDIAAYRNSKKSDAIDAYIRGESGAAQAMKEQYKFSVTRADIVRGAKHRAVALYKQAKALDNKELLNQALELKRKYGFIVSKSDLD